MAQGILGQYIYVNPQKNLIIVRLGKNHGKADWDGNFKKLRQSVLKQLNLLMNILIKLNNTFLRNLLRKVGRLCAVAELLTSIAVLNWLADLKDFRV